MTAAGVAGLLAAGCGSAHPAAAPRRLPAAEPSHDATLPAHPAGSSVEVGTDPQGIAVQAGANLVAVGVHDPTSVVLLSTRSGAVVGRVPIAADPRHLELGGPNGPFLVPEERADTLLELSEPSGRQRSFHVGSSPHDAAEADGYVYVSDEQGASVSEIEPDGAVRRIGGFTQPGGVAATGADVAVVDVGAFTLTLIDARTGQKLGRLPAGQGPTHCAAAGDRVWVVDTRGDAIITYSVKPFRRLGVTRLPGSPYGIGLDPVHGRLWVTETARNRVAELSLRGPLPRVIHTYPTQLQPDTVAVDDDTGRAYVANQVSGTVETITPASRR